MKKLYLTTLLSVGLSISAFAVQTTPMDTHGNTIVDPSYAGVSACEISNATGTAAVLCTSGSGIILAIYGSSVATTDPLVFRDSATANTSSTVLFSIDQKSIASRNIYPRFKNGLSVNALVSPTLAGTGNRPAWTVIYTADLK